LIYQWYFNSNAVLAATNSTLTISDAQTTSSGFYHLIITNGLGSVTSSIVTLSVSDSAPVITVQPEDALPSFGDTVTLSVTAVGSQPLIYQWYYVSSSIGDPPVPVAGGTNSTLEFLIIDSVTWPLIDGSYRVDITNSFGTTSSAPDVVISVQGR